MNIKLRLLSTDLSIVKFSHMIDLQQFASKSAFFCFTKTENEISVVMESKLVKAEWTVNTGWKALAIEGPLDFSLIGVLNRVLSPLADAGVSVFTISTIDTDYILNKEDKLKLALDVLKKDDLDVGG